MRIDIDHLKAGVTIAEILDDFGIPHKRSRCACPIHNGSNPNSFSFKEQYYRCHSCQEHGDVIDLIKVLLGTNDFLDAVKYLGRRKGIDINLHPRRLRPLPPRVVKSTPVRIDGELIALQEEREICEEKITIFSDQLQKLPQELKAGNISQARYYLQEQKLDHWLHHLDAEITFLNYQINCKRKDIQNDRKN